MAHWDLHLVLYFSLQRRNKSLKWLAAAVGDLLFPAFAFLRPGQTSRSGQSRTTPLPPQPSGEHPDQVRVRPRHYLLNQSENSLFFLHAPATILKLEQTSYFSRTIHPSLPHQPPSIFPSFVYQRNCAPSKNRSKVPRSVKAPVVKVSFSPGDTSLFCTGLVRLAPLESSLVLLLSICLSLLSNFSLPEVGYFVFCTLHPDCCVSVSVLHHPSVAFLTIVLPM